MPVRHFYLLSHYIGYRLPFLFSACWLQKKWMQEFLRREGGEVRSLLLTLSAMLNLFSSFNDDKMILQAITLHDKFIIILLRYIVWLDVCHTLHDAHLVARIPRYSWIRVYNESKGDSSNFLENDNALSLYCSLKKAPKLLTIHLPSKQ